MRSTRGWRVWVDTGGTFTDCLAIAPDGYERRAKVLSTSALRGRLVESHGRRAVIDARWRLVDGFADGARWAHLDEASEEAVVERCEARRDGGCVVTLSRAIERTSRRQTTVELRFAEEAPVLAARLATGAPSVDALPSLELRLATTRGTNALLERRGARVALLVTRGFADLLTIGDQRRPDLFALDIVRPEPLTHRVVEVPERLAADGSVVEPLDLESFLPTLESLLDDAADEPVDSVAIALLHAWRDDRHERALADSLRRLGCRHVSRSAQLVPSLGILPRAETAVADASLAPIVGEYLRRVERAVGDGAGSSVLVMTSAGGLVRSDRVHAKDTLLSGPAGGVVGAAAVGRAVGVERLLAFDMGGTSTDVARIGTHLDLRDEHRVGDARVAAPSLAIETVAAGGGSICRVEQGEEPVLVVGPRSAGADPGPACYGAGGPLTLTDVHLLLGRLDGRRFGLPIDLDAAERAFAEAARAVPGAPREQLLQGFLDIADERMAAAVRRISVRRGDDPAEHALVAFGGAGGLHACAVAAALGVSTVLVPRDAGLLSAVGLGAARLERVVRRPVLQPLDDADLSSGLDEASRAGLAELAAEGVEGDDAEIRRRTVFVRLTGQESTIEIDLDPPEVGGSDDLLRRRIERSFARAFVDRFGYEPPDRPLEVESLRVVASEVEERREVVEPIVERAPAPIKGRRRAYLGGRWREVPTIDPAALEAGHRFDGPALVFGRYATFVVEPDWRVARAATGTLVATAQCESAAATD